MADFYGFDFETDYLLFGDEFSDLPGVYVVYTEKTCLDIGITEHLREAIETHKNTRDWIKYSEGEDIYVAFHLDGSPQSRKETEKYLRKKIHPLL